VFKTVTLPAGDLCFETSMALTNKVNFRFKFQSIIVTKHVSLKVTVLNLILLDCYNKIFGSGSVVFVISCSELINFHATVNISMSVAGDILFC
jgi:hypothetical protein